MPGYALAEFLNIQNFSRSLTSALKLMCMAQEDRAKCILKKQHANQGMRMRYRPLHNRLKKIYIRKLDMELMHADLDADSKETTRMVRRIVEKRAAQSAYRRSGRNREESNSYRHMMIRAISFRLYDTSITDYNARERSTGTHWKKIIPLTRNRFSTGCKPRVSRLSLS